jgi:hypothetical protein
MYDTSPSLQHARFFDASSGSEEVSPVRGDRVDHGRGGCGQPKFNTCFQKSSVYQHVAGAWRVFSTTEGGVRTDEFRRPTTLGGSATPIA